MACAVIYAAVAILAVVVGQDQGDWLTNNWLNSIAETYKSKGDWQSIVRLLNLSDYEINMIDATYRDDLTRSQMAFQRWRNNTRSDGYVTQYTNLMNAIDAHNNAKSTQLANGVRPIGDLFLYNQLMTIVKMLHDKSPNAWENVVLALPEMTRADIDTMKAWYNSPLSEAEHAISFWSNRIHDRLSDLNKAKWLVKALIDTGNQPIANYITTQFDISDKSSPSNPTGGTYIYIPGTRVRRPAQITDIWLDNLATILAPQWKYIAGQLGISQSEINMRDNIQSTQKDHAKWALMIWWSRERERQTLQQMLTFLTNLIQNFYGSIVTKQQKQIPNYLSEQSITYIINNLGSNWRLFFESLGLTETEINRIIQDNTGVTQQQLIRLLFQFWFTRYPDPTWRNKKIDSVLQKLNLVEIYNYFTPRAYSGILSNDGLRYIAKKPINWNLVLEKLHFTPAQRAAIRTTDDLIRALVNWRDTTNYNEYNMTLLLLSKIAENNMNVFNELNRQYTLPDQIVQGIKSSRMTDQNANRPDTSGTAPIKDYLSEQSITYFTNNLGSNWRLFFESLGLTETEINRIIQDNTGVTQQQLNRLLFQFWFTRYPDPTWRNKKIDSVLQNLNLVEIYNYFTPRTYSGILSNDGLRYIAEKPINWNLVLEKLHFTPAQRAAIRTTDDLIRALINWRDTTNYNEYNMTLLLLSKIAENNMNVFNELNRQYTVPDQIVQGIKNSRMTDQSANRPDTSGTAPIIGQPTVTETDPIVPDTGRPMINEPDPGTQASQPVPSNTIRTYPAPLKDEALVKYANLFGPKWIEVVRNLGLGDSNIRRVQIYDPSRQGLVALKMWRDMITTETKEKEISNFLNILRRFPSSTSNQAFTIVDRTQNEANQVPQPAQKKFVTINKNDLLTEKGLQDLANNLGKDWVTVARGLGFTDNDILIIVNKYIGEPEKQGLEALRQWARDPRKENVSIDTLLKALMSLKPTYILGYDPNQRQRKLSDLLLYTDMSLILKQLTPEEWSALTSYLKVPSAIISQNINDYPNLPTEQRTNTLQFWKDNLKADPEVKVYDFVKGLENIKRGDLAETIKKDYEGVKELISKPRPSTSSGMSVSTWYSSPPTEQLTDQWLEGIAENIKTYWKIIYTNLNMDSAKIAGFETSFPNDLKRQATAALIDWRNVVSQAGIGYLDQYKKLTAAIDDYTKKTVTNYDYLTNANLHYLSTSLGSDWERILGDLGVNQTDIIYIKENYGPYEWISRSLYKWRDEYHTPSRETKNTDLINALNRHKLINILEYLYKQQPSQQIYDLLKDNAGEKPKTGIVYIPGTQIPKPTKLTDSWLYSLAKLFINNWEQVAGELSLTQDDIDSIKRYYQGPQKRAQRALIFWRDRSRPNSNLDTQFNFLTRLVKDFYSSNLVPQTGQPQPHARVINLSDLSRTPVTKPSSGTAGGSSPVDIVDPNLIGPGVKKEFTNTETVVDNVNDLVPGGSPDSSSFGKPDVPSHPTWTLSRSDVQKIWTGLTSRFGLTDLANKLLANWEPLVSSLGLPNSEILRIKDRNTEPADQAYYALSAWRDMIGKTPEQKLQDLLYQLYRLRLQTILSDLTKTYKIQGPQSSGTTFIISTIQEPEVPQQPSIRPEDTHLPDLPSFSTGEVIGDTNRPVDTSVPTNQKPRKVIPAQRLKLIANNISDDWVVIAEDLGLDEREIKSIIRDNSIPKRFDKAYKALKTWQDANTDYNYIILTLSRVLRKYAQRIQDEIAKQQDNTRPIVAPDNTRPIDGSDNYRPLVDPVYPDNTRPINVPDNTRLIDGSDNYRPLVDPVYPDNTRPIDVPDNTRPNVVPDRTDNTRPIVAPDNTRPIDGSDNYRPLVDPVYPDNTRPINVPDNTRLIDGSDNYRPLVDPVYPDNTRPIDVPDNTRPNVVPDRTGPEVVRPDPVNPTIYTIPVTTSLTGDEYKPDYITNGMIQKIAQVIRNNEKWKAILRGLGWSFEDILRIERKYPNQPLQQAKNALMEWRDKSLLRTNTEKLRLLISILTNERYLQLVENLRSKKPISGLFLYPGFQTLVYLLQRDTPVDPQGRPAWEPVVKLLNITQDEIQTKKDYFPSQEITQGANLLLDWKNRSPKSDYEDFMDLRNALKNHPTVRDYINRTYEVSDLSKTPRIARIQTAPTTSTRIGKQDILENYGLERVVSMYGPGWLELLKRLRFSNEEINQIQQDQLRDPSGQHFLHALIRWRNRFSSLEEYNSKINQLLNELRYLGKTQIVQYFEPKKNVDDFFSHKGFEDLMTRLFGDRPGNRDWVELLIGIGFPKRYINQTSSGNVKDQAITNLIQWYGMTRGSHDAKLDLILRTLRNIGRPVVEKHIKENYSVKDSSLITDSVKVELEEPRFAAFRKQERTVEEETVPKDALSPKALAGIAENIVGNWTPIAKTLNLTDEIIQKIKSDHPEPRDGITQITQMLYFWNSHAKATTPQKLIQLQQAMDLHGQTSVVKALRETNYALNAVNQTVPNFDYLPYRRHGWTSDEGLKIIARELDLNSNMKYNLKDLAAQLGLSKDQIDTIYQNYGYGERALKVLETWRDMDTYNGTSNKGTKTKELFDELTELKYKGLLEFLTKNFAQRVCVRCPGLGSYDSKCSYNPCGKDSGKILHDGNYQICRHCDKYLSCVSGTPLVRPCAPGTVYDDLLKVCDHESNTCMPWSRNSIFYQENNLDG